MRIGMAKGTGKGMGMGMEMRMGKGMGMGMGMGIEWGRELDGAINAKTACSSSRHATVVLALGGDGCPDFPFNVADGHTASNTPDLFRPPKLSGAGPG